MSNVRELCALLAKADDVSFKDCLVALRTNLLLPSTSESHLNSRCCDNHACFLTDCCLPWLLDASKRETLNSTEVFDIGRLLNSLVETLRSLKVRLSSAQETAALKFVWQYWDYPAEITRHQCIRIFENILRLHLDDCGTCLEARSDKNTKWCEWLNGVLETVMRSNEDVRSRYKALVSLATLTNPSALTEKLGSNFPERLLLALNNRGVTVVVSELLCFLLSGASDSQMRSWTIHLARGLTSDCSWLRSSLKERVFPLLFKNNSRMCISLLEEIVGELSNNANSRTLDARLSIAQLRLRFDKSSIQSLSWNQLLDEDVMEDALSHADIELRLSAWHVLSDQPKLSHIIDEMDFRLITLFLSTNANEQHPAARQKILTGVKKIFIRMRESAELLVKNDVKSVSIDHYISFLKWLLELSFDCLREGANMGRRSTGLGILQLLFLEEHLHDSVKSSFYRLANPTTWLKNEQISALIAILDDPFEFCQRAALNILRSLPRDVLSFLDFDNILSVTFNQLLSLKARTVYGAAYRLKFYLCVQPREESSERAIGLCRQLIRQVSERIESVSRALLNITESHSVYGLLHGISAVLQVETFDNESRLAEWHKFVSDELLPVCGKVAEVVAPVVHSASPEGFIPPEALASLGAQDEQTSARVHSRTCQVLLVSCWRSMKEMSGIFEQLVRAPYPTMIDQKALEWMSAYYWLQLTECKHFGAFGTAVDGFTRLCEKLWSLLSHSGDFHNGTAPDPQAWLDEIVSSLETGKESMKLCKTRRSAGLPHLVCAILATEPKGREGKSLDQTISRLLVIADSWRHLDITLCVHALNVLRVVFRDARLAEAVGGWAEGGLRTAVNAFGADTWAVRNAGSQLLTSMLIRVFGVPQTNDKSLPTVSSARANCLSAFEFFRRYPSMFPFLLSTLTSPKQQSGCLNDEFALFPAVIILARIYPSLEGSTSLSPFVPHLMRIALGSRIEKLRVLATAALAAVCEPDDWLLLLRSLRNCLMPQNDAAVSQNTVNGALLLLHSAVSQGNSSNVSVHSDAVVDIVNKLQRSASWLTWCEYNKALLAEILAFVPADDEVLLKMMPFVKGSLVGPLGRLLARNLLIETSACWKHWHTFDAPLKRAVIKYMSKSPPSENEHLLSIAVDELIVCQDEFTLRKLLKILLNCSGSFELLKKIVERRQSKVLEAVDRLIEAGWILRASTLDRLMLLRSELTSKMGTKTIEWLDEVTQRETVAARRIGLATLTEHMKKWRSLNDCTDYPPTISIAILRLLQDEDCLIREETAAVVSSVTTNEKTRGDRSLNAVICVGMLVKAMQSSEEHSRALNELRSSVRSAAPVDDSPDEEDNRLFDRSVSNSYTEWFLLQPLFNPVPFSVD